MAKSQAPKKNQNLRYIFFGLLIVIFAGTLYFELSDDKPQTLAGKQGTPAATSSQPAEGRVRNSDLTGKKDPFDKSNDQAAVVKTSANTQSNTKTVAQVFSPDVLQPLPLELIRGGHPSYAKNEDRMARGNVFNYWVAPPEIPKPFIPPPPPPVTVSGVQPQNVYARTGGFTMKVYGDKFQPDSQAMVGSMPFKTKFISAKELEVEIPTAAISVPGDRDVTVVSKNPEFKDSSKARFTITAPPTPPYKYVGMLVTNGETVGVILVDGDVKNVRINDKVEKNGRWVVRAINNQRMEFEDMQLRLLHAIPFTGNQ